MRVELIVSDRIKAGCCPDCGGKTKCKGGYVHCVGCGFTLSSGTWAPELGYAVRLDGESDYLEANSELLRAADDYFSPGFREALSDDPAGILGRIWAWAKGILLCVGAAII